MNGNSSKPRDKGSFSGGEPGGARLISIEQLRHLVRLLDRSDVTEVELRRAEEGVRLVLRKVKAPENSAQQAIASSTLTGNALPPVEANTMHSVVAPLVGIFHSATKPRGKALVAVGDHVKTGQHIAAIESLNVINEVEAPVAGRVIEILVQEGQPVEYGQALMTIDGAREAEGA
jgi:acetyl-CoA carboxylase biotin carboxyl carrier protein